MTASRPNWSKLQSATVIRGHSDESGRPLNDSQCRNPSFVALSEHYGPRRVSSPCCQPRRSEGNLARKRRVSGGGWCLTMSEDSSSKAYHEDSRRFRVALTHTASVTGFSERLIEKDYYC